MEIKLTPEELERNADQYGTGAETIDQLLITLRGVQGDITSIWSGNAFDSFNEQFEARSKS